MNELRNQLVKNLIRPNINEDIDLTDLFFSDENINLINKQIVLLVWKRTDRKYKIAFQCKNQIMVVMTYIFTESAKHLPYKIKEQIYELNCKVVDAIYPSIITNFEQKIEYIKYIETKKELLDLPKSTKSNKTLPTIERII